MKKILVSLILITASVSLVGCTDEELEEQLEKYGYTIEDVQMLEPDDIADVEDFDSLYAKLSEDESYFEYYDDDAEIVYDSDTGTINDSAAHILEPGYYLFWVDHGEKSAVEVRDFSYEKGMLNPTSDYLELFWIDKYTEYGDQHKDVMEIMPDQFVRANNVHFRKLTDFERKLADEDYVYAISEIYDGKTADSYADYIKSLKDEDIDTGYIEQIVNEYKEEQAEIEKSKQETKEAKEANMKAEEESESEDTK